jgi:hypothetical protein
MRVLIAKKLIKKTQVMLAQNFRIYFELCAMLRQTANQNETYTNTYTYFFNQAADRHKLNQYPKVFRPTDTLKSGQSPKKMFDPTKLTESDKNILADFYRRRKLLTNTLRTKD